MISITLARKHFIYIYYIIGISYLDCDYRICIVFADAPSLFLTLYVVYISFYVTWTDMSENKLFVIVIVIVALPVIKNQHYLEINDILFLRFS